jgi:hypothetical protein
MYTEKKEIEIKKIEIKRYKKEMKNGFSVSFVQPHYEK